MITTSRIKVVELVIDKDLLLLGPITNRIYTMRPYARLPWRKVLKKEAKGIKHRHVRVVKTQLKKES